MQRSDDCNGIKLTGSCEVDAIHKAALNYIFLATNSVVNANPLLREILGLPQLTFLGFAQLTIYRPVIETA